MQRNIRTHTDKNFILDVSGEDGNAFALMAITKNLLKQVGTDHEPVMKEMMSGDYSNLLTVMARNVGQFIYFDNVPEQYIDALEGVKDAYDKPIEYSEAYDD